MSLAHIYFEFSGVVPPTPVSGFGKQKAVIRKALIQMSLHTSLAPKPTVCLFTRQRLRTGQ